MERDYVVPPHKLRLLANSRLQVLYLAVLVGVAVVAAGAGPLGGVLVGLMAATVCVLVVALGYVFYVGVHNLPDTE